MRSPRSHPSWFCNSGIKWEGNERGSWTERNSIQALVVRGNARHHHSWVSRVFWRNNKCHLVAALGIAMLYSKISIFPIYQRKINKAKANEKNKQNCVLNLSSLSFLIYKKRKIWINDLQQPFHIIFYNSSFPLKIFCLPGIMQTQWGISGGLELFIVVVRCFWFNINKTSTFLVFSICKQNSCVPQDE